MNPMSFRTFCWIFAHILLFIVIAGHIYYGSR